MVEPVVSGLILGASIHQSNEKIVSEAIYRFFTMVMLGMRISVWSRVPEKILSPAKTPSSLTDN